MFGKGYKRSEWKTHFALAVETGAFEWRQYQRTDAQTYSFHSASFSFKIEAVSVLATDLVDSHWLMTSVCAVMMISESVSIAAVKQRDLSTG